MTKTSRKPALPQDPDKLFALEGERYESAVMGLLAAAGLDRGWNPLGGESDDYDVAEFLPQATEGRPAGDVRVFQHDKTNDVLAATRVNSHPWVVPILRSPCRGRR